MTHHETPTHGIDAYKIKCLATYVDRGTCVDEREFNLCADNQALALHVSHHFPNDWDVSTPRAENILTVCDLYLSYDRGDPETRLDMAFETAADRLDKSVRQIRNSCGVDIYNSPAYPIETYKDIFLDDLCDLEADWQESQSMSLV